jgi:hypothetical protein
MFGTVEAPYWKHNPGSRERLPKRAAGIRPLTPDDGRRRSVVAIRKADRLLPRPPHSPPGAKLMRKLVTDSDRRSRDQDRGSGENS